VATCSKEKKRKGKEERKKEKFETQALAYLMSIVCTFICFCTLLLIVGHH
jgi:hypothetical protein